MGLLLNRFKHLDKDRYNKHVDLIHKNTGKPKLFIKLDIILNTLTRGSGYTDYFRGDYINLTSKEKDTFVTIKSFNKIVNYLNNEEYVIVFNDKILFNKIFNKYIKRDYIDLRVTSFEDFCSFLKNKKNVFAKNPKGEGGYQVEKIKVSEFDALKLYNKLMKKGFYLLEEEIIQSKELNEINPNAVNCFRVMTLLKEGKVYIVGNALRVNQGKDGVIGSSHDLYFSFNEDGYIDSNVIDDYGNIYEEHPLTHKKFKDVCIKDVKKAFDMCKEAALLVPEVRYIGWDIGFTDKGPVMIEGNEYPGFGLVQHFKLKNSRTGHKKVLYDILKDEVKNIK
jgi:glutathione synthase/RimK-type ligase-like ATP-grasp enzyme